MAETPGNDRVVGVFPDQQSADAAARAASEAGGDDVTVGADADRVASLRGEMREEGSEAWAGPSVGLYTKEMARSVPLWTVVGVATGALAALPLALVFDGLSLGMRLLIAAFAGGFTGGTIGFIAGGGFFGPRRKAESEMAEERGIVVGATDSTGKVSRSMSAHGPVRVDRVTGASRSGR